MCRKKHLIYTRKGKPLVVDCGHCDECRQAKANRYTQLIRNESIGNGYITFFLTLTYNNKFIPYVNLDEIRNDIGFLDHRDLDVNVYRHCSVRRVRLHGNVYGNREYVCRCIDTLTLEDTSFVDIEKLRPYRIPSINKNGVKHYVLNKNKVGILYLPDIQNFFKSLKIDYERSENRKLEISYFYVGEYGPDTLRPHFHVAARVPVKDKDKFPAYVCKNWKFCDWTVNRQSKCIQIARNCASYISSYVNQHTYLSKIYDQKALRPFCSHTKFYGRNNGNFSFYKILESFYRRDLHYTQRYYLRDSCVDRELLLPSYVIEYFFPKFKGYSSLSTDELRSIYFDPYQLRNYCKRLGYSSRYDKIEFYEFLESFKKRHCLSGLLPGNYSSDKDVEFWTYLHRSVKMSDYILNLRKIFRARHRFCVEYVASFGEPDCNLFDLYASIASQESHYNAQPGKNHRN